MKLEMLEQSADVLERAKKYLHDPAVWEQIFFTALKIVIIYIACLFVIRLSNKVLQHVMQEREKRLLKVNPRRTRTIARLASNVIKYTVYFVGILLILSQVGVNLVPLIAGAGVLGLAIGFGAQSLVKDVITGFFILFEDQFAVGDVIQVGGVTGTVEEIGLRVTQIRSWTGEVHYIPNGSISNVTNMSKYHSVAVVDVTVGTEANLAHVMELLKEAARKVYHASDQIIKEPSVLGIESLGKSDMVLRITAECKPATHEEVARKLREEIKSAFDREQLNSAT